MSSFLFFSILYIFLILGMNDPVISLLLYLYVECHCKNMYEDIIDEYKTRQLKRGATKEAFVWIKGSSAGSNMNLKEAQSTVWELNPFKGQVRILNQVADC